jgi:hypothetical protein
VPRASRLPWILVGVLLVGGAGGFYYLRRPQPENPPVVVQEPKPAEAPPIAAQKPQEKPEDKPEEKAPPAKAEDKTNEQGGDQTDKAAEAKPSEENPAGEKAELAAKPVEEKPAARPKPTPPKKPSRGAALQQEGLRLRMAGLEDRALLAYRGALADETLPPALRAEAEAQVIALSRKFGELEILSAVGGAEVSVDGRPVGRTPLREPILVRPGKHQISLSLSGYQTRQTTVTVPAGGKELLRLTPQR